jgi:hypothetical protein
MYAVPIFTFNLEVDSIANWVKLYAPVIRCSMDEERNLPKWAFFQWHWAPNEAHSTACLFMGNTQIFFDPSLALSHVVDVDNENVLRYFSMNHVWLPSTEAVVKVVDQHLIKMGSKACAKWNLQRYFEPLSGKDPCDLGGCCTTLSILVVWLCLRFGCRDPQVMVHALRCVMENGRRYITDPSHDNEFTVIMHKLRKWQIEMSGDKNVKHENLLRWIGIKVPTEACRIGIPCNYMLYDTNGNHYGFCGEFCENGYTWCHEHTPARIRDAMYGPVRPKVIPSIKPPRALHHWYPKHSIQLVASFEHRWGLVGMAFSDVLKTPYTPMIVQSRCFQLASVNGNTSPDTLDIQIANRSTADTKVPKLGIARFLHHPGWDEPTMIQLLRRTLIGTFTDERSFHRRLQFMSMDALIIQFALAYNDKTEDYKGGPTFLPFLLQNLPISPWVVGAILNDNMVVFLSLDMGAENATRVIDYINLNIAYMVYIRVRTMEHMVHLAQNEIVKKRCILHVDMDHQLLQNKDFDEHFRAIVNLRESIRIRATDFPIRSLSRCCLQTACPTVT